MGTSEKLNREALVLVDYDNLPVALTRRDSTYLVDRVLAVVPPELASGVSRASFRLYGGWYAGSDYTHRAQLLDADLQAAFPSPRPILLGAATDRPPLFRQIPVGAELAVASLSAPSLTLHRTFRTRNPQANLRASNPLTVGCRQSPCMLEPIYQFLDRRTCPQPGCAITPEQVLKRDEQKMVDTMIAADLLFATSRRQCLLIVVSSDDDLLPPIRTAVDMQADILHVHTRKPSPSATGFDFASCASYCAREI